MMYHTYLCGGKWLYSQWDVLLNSFLPLVFGKEPSWTFVQPESACEKQTSRNQLDAEGNQPLSVTRSHCLADAVVDLHLC